MSNCDASFSADEESCVSTDNSDSTSSSWNSIKLDCPINLDSIKLTDDNNKLDYPTNAQQSADYVEHDIGDDYSDRFLKTYGELERLNDNVTVFNKYLSEVAIYGYLKSININTTSHTSFAIIKDTILMYLYIYLLECDSTILNLKEQRYLSFTFSHLIGSQKLQLLYRASRDGTDCQTFHKLCAYNSRLFIIIETEKNYVFGGYTGVMYWNDNIDGNDCSWIKLPVYLHGQHMPCIFLLRGQKGRIRNYLPYIRQLSDSKALYNGKDGFGMNFHWFVGFDGVKSHTKRIQTYIPYELGFPLSGDRFFIVKDYEVWQIPLNTPKEKELIINGYIRRLELNMYIAKSLVKLMAIWIGENVDVNIEFVEHMIDKGSVYSNWCDDFESDTWTSNEYVKRV